jgi:hypothetical protein
MHADASTHRAGLRPANLQWWAGVRIVAVVEGTCTQVQQIHTFWVWQFVSLPLSVLVTGDSSM